MTPDTPIRVFARGSPLSRVQAEEALQLLRHALPHHSFHTTFLDSVGDKDQQTPLTDPNLPSDFFTRELDAAQLDGRADLVVHSAKDLPDPLPHGITLAALLPARDTRDALVVRPGADLLQSGIVGTSSPVREAAIKKLYPRVSCKPIRGSIQRRLEQLDQGHYDAVIIAACALQRLEMHARISEFLPYQTTPQQGRLALTVPSHHHDLLDALRPLDVRRYAGPVALVGCPADPGLLGTRAHALLRAADIVLHDRLVPRQILEPLGDRAEYVGKKGHAHSTTQPHIHRRILHEAEKGHLVVRLHGGDPGVLGHLGETLDFCRDWNLRSEVLPAVSAAQLTAARAQCPLTHRHEGRSITFLSGHQGLADHPLSALSPQHGNLAIYMGVRDIAAIRQRLLEANWLPDTPVTAGIHLGNPDEHCLPSTLHRIHTEPLATPAVLLVGPRPHLQPHTLFTGTDPDKFLRHGPFIHFPMIQRVPRPTPERAHLLQQGLPRWDGMIFPSSRIVDLTLDALLTFGDTRLLAHKKLLAVGPHTADALLRRGLRPDAAPTDFQGVAALANLPPEFQGHYGYPTSDQSPLEDRKAALAPARITLDPLILHETRPTTPDHLPNRPFHRVLFTSSSTVHHYFNRFPTEKSASREWLALGQPTLQTLRKLGLHAQIA